MKSESKMGHLKWAFLKLIIFLWKKLEVMSWPSEIDKFQPEIGDQSEVDGLWWKWTVQEGNERSQGTKQDDHHDRIMCGTGLS